MENKAYFPMFVDLSDKRILVFGAGKIATRRIKTLLKFGARITAVAPKHSEELNEDIIKYNIEYQKRVYEYGEIKDAFLVISATNDKTVDNTIYKECKEKDIVVNIASDKEKCDFYFPGIVKKDNIVIGVNAGGVDHKEAKIITNKIKGVLD